MPEFEGEGGEVGMADARVGARRGFAGDWGEGELRVLYLRMQAKTRDRKSWGVVLVAGGFWVCDGVGRGWRAPLREELGARGGCLGTFGEDFGVFRVDARFSGQVPGREVQLLAKGRSVDCYINLT